MIPTAAYLIVLWIWEPLSGEVSQRPFFEATATVFPVLLLTLAVQARFFGRQARVAILRSDKPQPESVTRFRRWIVRVYAAQALAVLGMGELASLRALANSDGPTIGQTAQAWAALLGGFIAVAIVALSPAATAALETDKTDGS